MSSSTDQLARLRALIDAGQPLPDDVAEWLLFRLEDFAARDRDIADYVRLQMRGPSTWSRCLRLSQLAQSGDVVALEVLRGARLGPRQIFRIVTGR